MEDKNRIEQLKTSNPPSYSTWVELHFENIARFACQCGCDREQALQVVEETFRDFYPNFEKLEDGGRLVRDLYKIAIEKLAHIQLIGSVSKNVLAFEEDQQLHEKILTFNKIEKTAFILSQFHEMDHAEISSVLEMSEASIQRAVSEVYKDLDEQEPQLKKQLKFLGKSYKRLSFSFNTENVFQKPQEQKEEFVKQKPPLSKKVLFAWLAGIVTLLVLITVSVVTGEEYQNSSAEKYVEKLKVSFENEIANKFDKMGLTEEIDKSREVYPGQYAEVVRDEFETLTRKIEAQITRNEKINKKETGQQYDEILSKLEIPSEMVERLFENPLTNNKEKSEAFISEYVEKVQVIQQSIFGVLAAHEDILEDAIIDGEIDIEKFLSKKDSYPEDLQEALEGMIKQNLYPKSFADLAPIYPIHVNNEISKRIRDSLHEDVVGYVTVIESEPFILYPFEKLVYPVEDSIDYLIEIEKTLLATHVTAMEDAWLSGTYVDLLNGIVTGSGENSLYNSEGVSEEYRTAWKRLASIGEESPSAFVIGQIVDEMEASDWKVSRTRSRIDSYNLMEALDYAKDGNLASFTLDGKW